MSMMRRRPAGLGVLFAVWFVISPGLARAQSAAGATPADFSVDGSGNATAFVEIAVPPGPHGVQPKLALVYSSAMKNGLIGVGWTLQGVSAITRGGPAKFYDGDDLAPYFGQVSYTTRPDGSTNDRFFLDGQRLIAVKNGSGGTLSTTPAQNAAYGKAGTVYHTAVESWVKVTSQGTAGAGPQYFVVYQKDGTMMEFGKTDNSRILVPGGPSVRVWALSEVRDPNGNAMTFSYDVDNTNGEYRIASISYTSNTSVSPAFAARSSVRFAYENRADPIIAYQGSHLSRLTKRLTEISTHVGSTKVRSYRLAYEYGQATKQSRLTRLQECDGAGACMPATTFSYSDFAPNGTFDVVTPNQTLGMLADKVLVHTGDYNGDGRADFLRQEKADWDDDTINSFSVYFSEGNGQFNIVTPVGDKYQTDLRFDPGANILPGDFNGDGLTDFLKQEKGANERDESNTFNVYFSQGDGYFNIQTPQGWMYQYDLKYDEGCNLIPSDVDGDGVSDFLRQEKNNWIMSNADNTFNVYFSQRNGYFTKVLPTGARYQEDMKYNPGALIHLGDYNGDGAADFLRQEWNGWDDNNTNTFQVYFSRRDGYSNIIQPPGDSYQYELKYDPGTKIWPGDFNGDGLQDFIKQEWNGWSNNAVDTFWVYLSRGNGYFDIVKPSGNQYQEQLRYNPGAFIIPGDFNGDGRQDFLRQERSGWSSDNSNTFNVYLSKGDGTFDVHTPPGSEYQTRLKADNGGVVLTVADFNGDGIDDFMAMRKTTAEGSASYWTYLSKGPRPDLLTAINDGLHKTTTITYKPLTDPSVYSKAIPAGYPSAYPWVVEQPTQPVVASFTLADNNGNSVRQDYTYEAFMTMRGGPGTSSFTRVHKLDVASNVKQTTEYNQSTFLDGQVRSISKTHGGTLLEKTEYTYYADSAATSRPYTNVSQPLLQRTDVKHYTGGTLRYTTRQEYTYDGYGNITKLVDHGDTNTSSERLYTTTQYNNNESSWMLGLVSAVKQSRADGSPASSWDAAKDLSWEKTSYDTRGNVLRQERYDDQNNAWVANVTTRDGFGDPITSVDPIGSTATLLYDDSHTYVRERQIANGTQPTLITRFVYDTRFGEMTSQTDPNNRQLSYTLDGFGRYTIVSGPRPDDPNQRVELIRREWANTAQGLVGTIWSRTHWSANFGNTTNPWFWEKQYSDGFGRVYKKESLGPDARTVVEDTRYTPQGWISRRSFPHWSTETGNSLPGVDIAYDPRGLPTTITSGGIVTRIALNTDGKSFTRTEADGTPSARTSSYTMNSRLKVVRKTDPEGNVTQIEYDPLSRPTRVTDPGGVVNTTSYTSLGLKKEVSNPDTGIMRFTYSNGLLSSETDARGNTSTYVYDPLSRVRTKTIAWQKAGTAQSTILEYRYDTAPGTSGYANLLGNLHSVTTRTQGVYLSEYRYGYDVYGRESVTEVRVYGAPGPFVFRYGYDPMGRKIEQIYPDNARAVTTYQPSGNMSGVAVEDAVRGVRGASTPYTTYSGYTARREPTAVAYGNGVQAALTFDATLGMLTSNKMTRGAPSSASSPVLVNDQYRWNPLGDVIEIKDLRTAAGGEYDPYPFHNTTRAFTYSAAGRIATASAPGTYGNLAYSYSRGGDLLTKDGVTYTIGTGHRVVSGQRAGASVFSAAYDDRGNRVTSQAENGTRWDYSYDGENRLLEVQKNSTVVGQFEYDHTGRRTRKVDVATGTTVWYISPDYEVTTFGASLGGKTQHTKYIVGLIGPAASITRLSSDVSLAPLTRSSRSLTPGDNGAGHPIVGTYFLHKDHVGSTHVVTDHTGRVVSRTVYKPFGEIDLQSSEGSDIYRAKFGGQELDGESGLYYFNARYYDARIGRFISADSVMGAGFLELDAFNRYAFAGNNPIRNIDPSGHSFIVGLIVGAIVGATVAIAQEVIQQGIASGWGNFQVGKIIGAGVKGAISGLVSAAVGGGVAKGVTKVADKTVKKLTEGARYAIKRAVDVGVSAVAGAASSAAAQATLNGIQAARGQEVDWARTMIISVSVGAITGGVGEGIDVWRQSKQGGYDLTSNNQGPRPGNGSAIEELHVQDHIDNSVGINWGLELGKSMVSSSVSAALNAYFDDSQNNSDTTGNAFSVQGIHNAPAPQYNGRMLINVVARDSCLRTALEALEEQAASE